MISDVQSVFRTLAARALAGFILAGLPALAQGTAPAGTPPDSAAITSTNDSAKASAEAAAVSPDLSDAASTAAMASGDPAYDLKKTVIRGRSRSLTRKETPYVSRMPLKNLETPQAYMMVTKELIDQQMAVDYNSAFKNIPGSSRGVQWMQGHSQFYTRGFLTSTEIRNGLSVNLATDIDPVNVERIEAIRGPAGALFGAGSGISYGGLFNQVAKTPFESHKGNVSLSGGSWNLGRVTADVNTPLNAGKTLLLRVNMAKHNEGSFMDQGYTDSWTAAPSLVYKVNDRLTLSLEAEVYKKEGTAILSTSVGEGVTAGSIDDLGIGYRRSFTNNGLTTTSRTTNLFSTAEYKLSEKWSSETVVAFTNSQSDLFSGYLNIFNDSQAVRWLDNQAWKINTRQFQENFRGEFSTGPVRNQMLFGVGVSNHNYIWPYTVVADTVNYRNPGPGYHLGLEEYRARIASEPLSMWEIESYTYYGYVSDALHIGDRFTALLGLRWDRFDNRGGSDGLTERGGRYEQDALSPKAGLVFQPVVDRLSLYANYMGGYQNVNGRSTGGGTFSPEHAHQGEVGVKLQAAEGKLSGTVALYSVQVQDLVRSDPQNPGFSVQDGTQNSMGAEVDISAQPIRGLDLIAGYAFNRSELTKADSAVVGRRPPSAGPELAANFWASYNLPSGAAEGLGAGVGANYASKAYNINRRSFVFQVPEYMVWDATLFYDRPAYRFGLKVDNLANAKYWSPEYLQAGAPRRFIGNVTYKF